jgi:hypothetical protein
MRRTGHIAMFDTSRNVMLVGLGATTLVSAMTLYVKTFMQCIDVCSARRPWRHDLGKCPDLVCVQIYAMY